MDKICLVCGSQFTRHKYWPLEYWNKRRTCAKKCYYILRKGLKINRTNPPWNKGKIGVYSKESIEKMRVAKIGKPGGSLGKKMSEETKEKIRQKLLGVPTGRSGKKCNWWQGGKTSINQTMRNSLECTNWRRAVFKRDNYKCQECGDSNYQGRGKSVQLEAHHIKPFYKFPELATELSNGITLCIDCHRLTDSFGRPKKVDN